MKIKKKRPVNLKLKAAIIESGETLESLSESLDINKSTLSRKINGHVPFTEIEIVEISKVLKKNITDIFFTNELHQKQHAI